MNFGASIFFFSSRRRHTRYWRDWSSDVCSSDLNNIALYRNIERNRVEEICDLLEIDNVIKGLSEGYDTIINSKGVDLSEGQKQRICIARGLVDEGKSVYIFDEIISSLDKTISEKIILYLKKISNNSIVIISSHKDLKDVTDVVEYSLL